MKKLIGIDINALVTPLPGLSDLDIPPSRPEKELRDTPVGTSGTKYVQSDDEIRVIHGLGKGVRDLMRVHISDFGRLPGMMVYPTNEDEVVRIVSAVVTADVVVIPSGGGSSIVAALGAEPGEQRQVVSVNLGRMDQVLAIDEQPGLAHIQAGVFGPDMEEQLQAHGWTMGHHPDSFVRSTLGGWIATRSSGMQSDKYSDMADICRGLRIITPGQILSLRPLPSTSSNPSVCEMVLDSEGRLGVITSAWMNVHRIPEMREIQAYFFPTYEDGLKACEQVVSSGAFVVVARVSDAIETQYIMANRKRSSKLSPLLSKGIERIILAKDWDLERIAMAFVGFEGSANHVTYGKELIGKTVRTNGGPGVGRGPGTLYDQKKYDTPYIRNFMLGHNMICDVSGTFTPWRYTVEIHTRAVAATLKATKEQGIRGTVFCHLSHSYHSGAYQYFTFTVADDSDGAMNTYDAVKRAIQQSLMDYRGTISHHHRIGGEHSSWVDQDISPAGVFTQRTLPEDVNPDRNLDPGKIVREDRLGISSNSRDA